MMARITPDQNFPDDSSQSSQHSEHNEGAQPPSEFYQDYVPQREFVLMPLFRRIGRMLGIKQAEEAEYFYAPSVAQEQAASAAQQSEQFRDSQGEIKVETSTARPEVAQTEQDFAATTPVVDSSQLTPMHFAEEDLTEEKPELGSAQTQDILGIEPEPEPLAHFTAQNENPATDAGREPASRDEIVEPVHPSPLIEGPVEVVAAETQPQEAMVDSGHQLHAQRETLIAAAAISEAPQQLPAAHPLSEQEASELVNQIREAASKISAAVAQAAEWLHTKEEEILNRAEMPLAPEQHPAQTDATQRKDEGLRVVGNALSVPEWESAEVPALQRERAWQDQKARPFVMAPRTGDQSSKEAEHTRGWRLRGGSLLASWRSIDWAQQFAPKRVAILGGVLMAILMVLGISFARRPASNDLPQQTRAIEPGGVTVTTHPQALASAPPVQAERRQASNKPAVEPHRTRRAADNEPDVVTHYYTQKPKPSPSHPTTAATGVRHYSDM